jgi:hypothetical protein
MRVSKHGPEAVSGRWTPWLYTFLLALSLAWPDSMARADVPVHNQPNDCDSDRDGLSDFQEIHKYKTDPHQADTGNTGVNDGDWYKRREFTYSVRCRMRIMPPVNLPEMNDDYQDVRVIASNDRFAEVEVVCYPLNTNADEIPPNRNWKRDDAGMTEFLEPGITTNWDADMRNELRVALARDGIHVDQLPDTDVVRQVSKWLFRRTRQQNMFCTHFVYFPSRSPKIFPGLDAAFEREKGRRNWTVPEQFEHELFARSMFALKCCGTCTSAATLEAAVLRALGIPARLIMMIPVVDASDAKQTAMLGSLTHHHIRAALESAAARAGNSYVNHAMLEVFVGNRWRRLNYGELGQNIVDPAGLGLMIHVHTFRDLSEASLAATWGLRYGLKQKDATFEHSNPYRTIELSDHFGRHAKVENHLIREHKQITLSSIYWYNAADAPEIATRSIDSDDGQGHLLAHADEWFDEDDYHQYRRFLERVDRSILLKAPGHPTIKATVIGSVTQPGGVHEFNLLINKANYAHMAGRVSYSIEAVNAKPDYKWRLSSGLTITRSSLGVEERLKRVEDELGRLQQRLQEIERKGPR